MSSQTSPRVDTAEAASMLGLSPERVRQLAQSGRLPARRERGVWTIDVLDIAAEQIRRSGYPVQQQLDRLSGEARDLLMRMLRVPGVAVTRRFGATLRLALYRQQIDAIDRRNGDEPAGPVTLTIEAGGAAALIEEVEGWLALAKSLEPLDAGENNRRRISHELVEFFTLARASIVRIALGAGVDITDDKAEAEVRKLGLDADSEAALLRQLDAPEAAATEKR